MLIGHVNINSLFPFRGVTFHSLLVSRWSSLVACYSLQNHSLLVAKFARYWLQKLLVAKINSLLVARFVCYSLQKLLVAEVARCKKSLVTRCEICFLHVATNYSLLVARCSLQKIINHSLKQSQVHKVRWKFFRYNLLPRAKKFKVIPSQHIKLKSVVSRIFFNATIYN